MEHYFELSATIERARADGDYRAAMIAARETYAILPEFVREWVREYGRFDIRGSHAVHTAPTLMAVLEDRQGIRELRAALESVAELSDWLPAARQAEDDVELVVGIMAAVQGEAGLLQSGLKTRLAVADGHRVSQLAAWLDKARRIRRVRKGSSYQLYPVGHSSDGSSPAARAPGTAGISSSTEVTSRRGVPSMVPVQAVTLSARSRPRRSAARARAVDVDAVPYVRLPKAPTYWEERQQAETPAPDSSRRETAPGAAARFVTEGEGWRIVSEEKLAPHERPNLAYKEVFPTAGSTFWLDSKGHCEGFEGAASVLLVTDRSGTVVAERALYHDVYRGNVNTEGSAILFMSREGVLHGYSNRIEQIIADRVDDLPEYRAQAERLGIQPQELRTHVRSVAIAADRSRYLVTVVDEAWCLSTKTGDVLWGLRLPAQEGWTKVVTPRTDRSGTTAEIEAALRLMELELPVSPKDITLQYRKLAMRWHPDRNPADSDATRRFQELGSAVELLTGTDLRGVGVGEAEQVTYQKILGRKRIDVPADVPGGAISFELTFSMGRSEKQAADWIYAANFASTDNRVFLAGYSGKVVEVSDEGTPMRAYDLGNVPRHIVETDSHLYLLTDTRLYVLSGDRLDALVDVFDRGDLIVGDCGFGLLGSKMFSWFTTTGRPVGGVRTKDPIRRVLSTPQHLIVDTRQHRAIVAGASSWWKD